MGLRLRPQGVFAWFKRECYDGSTSQIWAMWVKSEERVHPLVKCSKPCTEIYVNEIVHAIDGPPPEREQCVIGLDLCSDETPCPLHDKWKPIRYKIAEMLAGEHLDDLAERVTAKREKMKK